MSSYTTHTATHTVTTTPAVNGGVDAPKSIRQIMMQGILNGTPKHEVKAQVDALHPGSAASTKFSKHYGWYKSTMKKEGLLTVVASTTEPEADEESLEAQILELQSRLAARKVVDRIVTEAEEVERKQLEMLAEVEAKLAAQD